MAVWAPPPVSVYRASSPPSVSLTSRREGVVHLVEGLPVERADGEHQRADVHRQPGQIDDHRLVVAVARAGQVVPGVPDRAVVADQLAEVDHVGEAAVGVEHAGGVEVDLPLPGAEEALFAHRVPAQAHPDHAQRSARLLQRDPLALHHRDGHVRRLLVSPVPRAHPITAQGEQGATKASQPGHPVVSPFATAMRGRGGYRRCGSAAPRRRGGCGRGAFSGSAVRSPHASRRICNRHAVAAPAPPGRRRPRDPHRR